MRMIHQHVQVGRRLLVRIAIKIALKVREVVVAAIWRHLVSMVRIFGRALHSICTILCAGMQTRHLISVEEQDYHNQYLCHTLGGFN